MLDILLTVDLHGFVKLIRYDNDRSRDDCFNALVCGTLVKYIIHVFLFIDLPQSLRV